MRVCITSDVFPPDIGGIQTFTQGLAENISQDGRVENVVVLTFGNCKLGMEKVNDSLEVFRLPRKDLFRKGTSLLGKLFEYRNFDVFHSTTVFPSGFFTSCFTKFFSSGKFFVTIFGLDVLSGLKNRRTRMPVMFTLNEADGILAFSNFTKEEVGKHYRARRKLKTIYPGLSAASPPEEFNPSQVKEKYGIGDSDFVVLFVGRLVERKGVDDLIKEMSKLDQSFHLLIVGDGPAKQNLVELVQNLDLEDRVHFTGRVPRNQTFGFYELADIFCMPSKYLREKGDVEGLGLVFLEAQSYGVPVIGTDSGGIPEAIKDEKSGFVIPSENPKEISNKIMNLKEDSYLYQNMSRNAVQFVKQEFSWDRCVEDHIRVYKNGSETS